MLNFPVFGEILGGTIYSVLKTLPKVGSFCFGEIIAPPGGIPQGSPGAYLLFHNLPSLTRLRSVVRGIPNSVTT
jgi:hypothetical protein